MDLRFAEDLTTFRFSVREFIEATLDPTTRRRVERLQFIGRDEHMAWHRKLLARGWAAPAWPLEHGGAGWTLRKRFVFEQELARAHAPRPIFFGLDMLGPLLIKYGSTEQKQRFLPPILSGKEWWCQGFSEPGAGSDLAALKCRATRDGDEYVINGTKIWTSQADVSDWMGGLFRTDSSGRKQAGITLIMVPMDAIGLEVHPIKMIDDTFEVTQCFFNDVRVPTSHRVGPEQDGWTMAKYMLGVERLGVADVARTKALSQRIKSLRDQKPPARTSHEAIGLENDLATLDTGLLALEALEQRYLFDPEFADNLGAEASALKVLGSTLQQFGTEYAVDSLGLFSVAQNPGTLGAPESALPDVARAADWTQTYFNNRKLSIYGGANEVMKNVVAKAVLGL